MQCVFILNSLSAEDLIREVGEEGSPQVGSLKVGFSSSNSSGSVSNFCVFYFAGGEEVLGRAPSFKNGFLL